MNNKEYGVKLNLDMSKFNDSVQKAKSSIDGLQKAAGRNVKITGIEGLNDIKIKVDTSEVEEAEKKIKSAKDRIESGEIKIHYNTPELSTPKELEEYEKALNKGPVDFSLFGYDASFMDGLEADFEKVNNSAEKVKENVDEIGKKSKNADKEVRKVASSTSSLEKGMKKVINSVQRFTLSMIGVQSIWRVLSRSTSAYISKDIELSNKLSAVWVGIGAMLEPILSVFANGLLKIVSYLNAFVKGLTGVDLLAKAMDKTAKNTNKAAAAAKKLAGFDELNNINDTSGGGAETPDWTDAFKNVPIDQGIAEKLENLGAAVRNAFNWIKENWQIVVIAIGAIVGAFLLFKLLNKPKKAMEEIGKATSTLISSLGKAAEAIAIFGGIALVINSISTLLKSFAESGLSITEVGTLLGVVLGEIALAFLVFANTMKMVDWTQIAMMGVIFAGLSLVLTSVSSLIKATAKNSEGLNQIMGLLLVVFGGIVALMVAVVALGPSMTAGLVPFSIVMAEIAALLVVMSLTLPTILEATGSFIEQTAPSLERILTTIGKLITDIIDSLGTTLPPIINEVGKLFDKVFKGIALVIETVGNNLVKIMVEAGRLVNSLSNTILDFITRLGPAIDTFVSNIIKTITKLVNFLVSAVEFMVNSTVVDGLNGIIKGINKISKYVGINISLVPEMKLRRFVPSLSVGTDLVKEEGLAYLHAGEKVVPADVVGGGYTRENNEETNELLRDLISLIDSKEYNPYITVEDVGKASIKYKNRKARVLGGSL